MAPGARSKFGAHVRTWGLSEANVLYWTSFRIKYTVYLWHCWDFSAPPAAVRRPPKWFVSPIVIRRPGNSAPLPPSLRPCCQHGHNCPYRDEPHETYRLHLKHRKGLGLHCLTLNCKRPTLNSSGSVLWLKLSSTVLESLMLPS